MDSKYSPPWQKKKNRRKDESAFTTIQQADIKEPLSLTLILINQLIFEEHYSQYLTLQLNITYTATNQWTKLLLICKLKGLISEND